MKSPDKIFNFGRFMDFIFGIYKSKEGPLGYGLALQPHILSVGQSTAKTIHYLAYLYPRYRSERNSADTKTKKSKLKITVTPSKISIVSGVHKNLIPSENKELI